MLSEPCNPVWCMARVAALLSPYYDKATPQAVREIEAEDWLAELRGYPQWAIERAVRWWKSHDNPRRRQRPIEGDISARCIIELRGIRAIPALVQRRIDGKYHEPEPEVRRIDRERAAEIMAEIGVGSRRMENCGNARGSAILGTSAMDAVARINAISPAPLSWQDVQSVPAVMALVEALQFYGDAGKYHAPFTGGLGDLYFDSGEKARDALCAIGAKP